MTLGERGFIVRGVAAEGGEIEIGDEFLVVQPSEDEVRDPALGVGDRVRDNGSIQQAERLRQAHLRLPLALAGGFAVRFAEQVEEALDPHARRHHVRVGKRRGVEVLGQGVDLETGAGGAGNGVGQLLGAEPPRFVMGEVDPVVLVPLVRLEGRLIGPGGGDRPHQVAEVKVVLDQVGGQRVQEGCVDWLVRGADVVDRVDDAAAHEVAPDAVRDRGREVRVLRRRQPVGERGPASETLTEVRRALDRHQVLRRHDGVRLRVQLLVVPALVEDDLLAGAEARADAEAGEEGGHLEVLVLGPALEGVVVALGADHPHAHEELGRGLHRLLRIAGGAVVAGGRLIEGAARGGDQFADELVVGPVLLDRLAQPAAEGEHALVAHELPVAAQQIAPLEGPVVDVGVAGDQLVDQAVPFLLGRRVVGEERAHRLRARDLAGEIERGAAQEGGVVDRRRGQNLDPLELLVDQLVDVVRLGQGGPLEALAAAEHRDRRGGELPFVAHEQGALAATETGGDRAGGRVLDRHRLRVAARDVRLAGHVAAAAVTVVGDDDRLLAHSRPVHEDLAGVDLKPLDAVGRRVAVGHAAGDPVEDLVVVARAVVEPQAALVGHLHRRLGEHQRARGLGAVEAPAGHVVQQRLVVELRVVAAQRQLEAVLALGRAVAGARGAADLVHGGQDVADEGDGLGVGSGGGCGVDRDGNGGGQAGGLDSEGAVAGGGRREVAVVAALDGGAGGIDLGFAGEVDAFAAFQDACDEELAAVAEVVEGEFGGVDEEVDGGLGVGCSCGNGGEEDEGEEDGGTGSPLRGIAPTAGQKTRAPRATSSARLGFSTECHLPFTSIRALTGTVV